MNIEVTAVTEHVTEQRVRWTDARDWFTMIWLGVTAAAVWVYVYMHPSTENFSIAVGSMGAFGTLFHLIAVKDDKTPDAK